MNLRKLTPRERAKSFACAVRGVLTVAQSAPNAWIMLAASVWVVAAGLWFRVSTMEWCFLLGAVFIVFLAEAFNTAIEYLTDLAAPEHHPVAEKAKDAAGGAVLLAAVLALLIGLLVFGPRVLAMLR
jgi:diacylglycerol kinase (ATP)